jgi:hypothetical protein
MADRTVLNWVDPTGDLTVEWKADSMVGRRVDG